MKTSLFILAVLYGEITYAQTPTKDEIYSKIESSYAWLNFKMLETYATINLTEEQWTWVLKNDLYGFSSVNGLGNNLANFYELTSDAGIASDCRYKETSECLERIQNFSPKAFVEMNGSNTKLSDTSMKLALQALSTIGAFLGTENIYGTKSGWKPRGATVKFILNIDNATGQPKVIWNTDGTIATITMYVGSEAPDWRANLLNALQKGK